MAKVSLTASGKTRADNAVTFFSALRHTKGRWAGRPFELLAWQERVVRDLFGTLRRDGLRQYRTAYIEVPRKSGKSTLGSGLALLLLFEGEAGAEIYSAAADRDQASIVFEQAKAMVEASPDLSKHAKVYRRAIVVPRLGATYKVLSADAYTKHGLNAHGIVFDELHAQPNRELWDVLTTSTGARTQPLTVAITTAGYDRESICWEQHEYAERVLKDILEDLTFYPVILAADASDDWRDPATWRKANPSLGETVQEEYYAQEAKRAAEMPAYQNTFKRLLLNIWTQQSDRWIDLSLWKENGGLIVEDKLEGRPCYGGLDLASVRDMVAWVLAFPRDDDREFIDVLCRFWVPEARLHDDHNRYAEQYQVWAREGWLKTTPGEATDYAFVKRQILKDAQTFGLVDLNVDRLFNAHQLSTELQEEGLQVFGMGQGFLSMAAPMNELERRLIARKINHGNHPVLEWMADNLAVRQDPAGNLKPDKASSQGKIDGMVALLMALDRAMRHEKPEKSVYETRGLVTL